MEEQKKQIMQFVKEQKMKGHTITETLNDLKIKRSTYYAWSKQKDNKKAKVRISELTPEEIGRAHV